MARNGLTDQAKDLGPTGIAGVVCGAHAQVLSAAELSTSCSGGTSRATGENVSPEDAEENELAIGRELRILSSYGDGEDDDGL